MERLTEQLKNGEWIVKHMNYQELKEANAKLAAYENTNLEPHEVEALKADNERLTAELTHKDKILDELESEAIKARNDAKALRDSNEKQKEIAKEWVDECETLNKEIKAKDSIIVKDNRHINKLDKENEANKQRIAVLEKALKKFKQAFHYACTKIAKSKNKNTLEYRIELMDEFLSQAEKEQGYE